MLSIGKFKLDSIDRYENSCHNHLDVSFGKNGSRVKMIDTLTENIFHHLIKSARVSYFLIFLCYDSLSDTAKRWLEYEWILPDAQQRVLKLFIEWTADKDLFPIEISHSILHLLQKTEILSVIHLDSKRYQLHEFKRDQNTPLTALHRSGNSFSCIDYHKIYTCTFINFRMKNTPSNASVINNISLFIFQDEFSFQSRENSNLERFRDWGFFNYNTERSRSVRAYAILKTCCSCLLKFHFNKDRCISCRNIDFHLFFRLMLL